jgi:hypothetical protein
VPVVFLIAIAMVLVGIFFAATGRGGELAYEHADYAPLDLGPVSAADIALLRPPTAMWGYNMQVTDVALDQIARAMRERDVTIAYLQDQLATYERDGSRARLAPGEPLDTLEPPGTLDPLAIPGSSGAPTNPDPMEPPGPLEPHDFLEPSGPLEPHDAPEPPDALESPESPEPLTAAEPPADPATQAPGAPLTALILKASAPRPEPHESTQPSQILPDPEAAHDATEPSAVLRDDEESGEATQPSATRAADEVPGPQGAFDTHGWWAEQQEAAREEQAHGHAAGEQDDESVAAAEEQGW